MNWSNELTLNTSLDSILSLVNNDWFCLLWNGFRTKLVDNQNVDSILNGILWLKWGFLALLAIPVWILKDSSILHILPLEFRALPGILPCLRPSRTNLSGSMTLSCGISSQLPPTTQECSIRMSYEDMPMSNSRIAKRESEYSTAKPVSRRTFFPWTSGKKGRQRRWQEWCRQRNEGACTGKPNTILLYRGQQWPWRCSWKRMLFFSPLFQCFPRQPGTLFRRLVISICSSLLIYILMW